MADPLLLGLDWYAEQGPPPGPSTGLTQEQLDELAAAVGTPRFHDVAARLRPIPTRTNDDPT